MHLTTAADLRTEQQDEARAWLATMPSEWAYLAARADLDLSLNAEALGVTR